MKTANNKNNSKSTSSKTNLKTTIKESNSKIISSKTTSKKTSNSTNSKTVSVELIIKDNKNNTDISNQNNNKGLYEVKPYPGILFRFASSGDIFEIDSNANGKQTKRNFASSTVQSICIRRINGIIYYSINGGEFMEHVNHSAIESFTTTVVFGSSVTSDNVTPQRNFVGKLANMRVLLY